MPAKTPEQCDLLVAEAFNSGNVEAAVALYEPGATLTTDPGTTVTGTQAIREAITGFLAMKPNMKVEVPLVVQSGDTALLHSSWTMTGSNPDGSPVNMEGKGVEIVRRQADGNWLFIIDNPWGHPE